jgi:BexC/CtrB/KpsE family polysaccharide export inner-membrane protein
MSANDDIGGFDPNHGRRSPNLFLRDTQSRLKQIGTSRPFLAFTAVVGILLFVYCFLIAANIYVSEADFTLRGRETSTQTSLISSLTGVSTTALTETAEVESYIESKQMLDRLDKKFDLRRHYSRPRIDLFHWMPRSASDEDFLDFYNRMVKVKIDHETYLVTVEVRAFDAKTAHDVALAILDYTSEYVDHLSRNIRNDTLKAANQELAQAETSVKASRLAMTQYRTSTGLLDPVAIASAQTGQITSLQQQIMQARATMASMATYSTPNAPAMQQNQALINSLQAQINALQTRLTANKSGAMAQRLYEYEGLAAANEYAEKRLAAALASYDGARVLADQRERFLVRVTEPNMPDDPALPNRWLDFFEAMIIAIAAYGILALSIAGIRDHQGI